MFWLIVENPGGSWHVKTRLKVLHEALRHLRHVDVLHEAGSRLMILGGGTPSRKDRPPFWAGVILGSSHCLVS